MPIMPDIPTDLITLEQARAATGRTWPQLRYWIRSGKLRGWKQGHYIKVSRAELLGVSAKEDAIQPLAPPHSSVDSQANEDQTQ